MTLAKLPGIPKGDTSLPAFMSEFFLDGSVLTWDERGLSAAAQRVYRDGWADALSREPELFQRLVDEVPWEQGYVFENHKKAREFFRDEAQRRGTTVHHMLFGFPEEFDLWFDSGDAGGYRDDSAERALLLKFLLKDADMVVLRALHDYVGSTPLAENLFLKLKHFHWHRDGPGFETVGTARNLVRSFCLKVTEISYFDVYARAGVSGKEMRDLTLGSERVIIDAAMEGAPVAYAARAVLGGVHDVAFIADGHRNGVPVEYLLTMHQPSSS